MKAEDGFLGYGSPQGLEEAIRASEGADDTFSIYAQGIFFASVCSSLPFEEVKQRMSRVMTGTKGGWIFAEGEKFVGEVDNPAPCNQKPETHMHYLFNC